MAFANASGVLSRRMITVNQSPGAAVTRCVSGPGAAADRVNDASVVGAPRVSTTSGGKGEWVSANQYGGAWVQLTWPAARTGAERMTR